MENKSSVEALNTVGLELGRRLLETLHKRQFVSLAISFISWIRELLQSARSNMSNDRHAVTTRLQNLYCMMQDVITS